MDNKTKENIYAELSKNNVKVTKHGTTTDYTFGPYTLAFINRDKKFQDIEIYERIQNGDYFVTSCQLTATSGKETDVYRIYLAVSLKAQGKTYTNPYTKIATQKTK